MTLKCLKSMYSYSDMCSFAKIKDMTIKLPVTPSGQPDYKYMENYIRAQQKLVIADVVRYKAAVIAATRDVVGRKEAS